MRATPTDLPHELPRQFGVQPPLHKYSGFPNTQISCISTTVPSQTEGRFAIVTNAGWDAVDVDAPLTNGAEADGEVVWSCSPAIFALGKTQETSAN
jgi:hypothetical protein